MQVPTIKNDFSQNTSFGIKFPTKKTYLALANYYDVTYDKSQALKYKQLHNEAKSRLHYIKYLQNDNKTFELVENMNSNYKVKDIIKHYFDIIQTTQKASFEKLLSMYYYLKF